VSLIWQSEPVTFDAIVN